MSNPSHGKLIRRFYDELWNRGEPALADELFAMDYIRHDLRPGIAPRGQRARSSLRPCFGRLSRMCISLWTYWSTPIPTLWPGGRFEVRMLGPGMVCLPRSGPPRSPG